MKILIAGGQGFIGQHLSQHLAKQGHQIFQLTRNRHAQSDVAKVMIWDGQTIEFEHAFDVIINLCGQGIADKRWGPRVKQQLIDSRVKPTEALVRAINACAKTQRPKLLNASAIGYYPNHSNPQDELTQAPEDARFSSALIRQWEHAAQQAETSVVLLRFGVVLGRNGGMIKKLLLPTRLGLGMTMGHKTAMMSWCHIEDVCRAIDFIINHDAPKPIYNITAPNACSQMAFSQALAQACHRPCFLRMPAWVISRVFGQLGDELLLADQTIKPSHLTSQGFSFRFDNISAALENLVNQAPAS